MQELTTPSIGIAESYVFGMYFWSNTGVLFVKIKEVKNFSMQDEFMP